MTAPRQPILFIGHGSPLNAIADNEWSQAFRRLGADLARPRAVLSISAHWWTEGSWVTAEAEPRTIHDFGGFPRALFEVQYPAPGAPDLAARVRDLVAKGDVQLRTDWGLDHGTWSVLVHMLPAADVPVVQLSLDARATPAERIAIGRALGELRDEGVLVLASGNITHNLADAFSRQADPRVPDWARDFDGDVARALEQHDLAWLAGAWAEHPSGRQAHPHPDHWFPLLYAAAAAQDDDPVSFPIQGFDLGSLSMRAVRWG